MTKEGEVDSVEAKDVNIDGCYLIYVTDRNADFRLEVSLDYSADVTYYDPDSGIYDHEKGAMLYRKTIDKTLERTVELALDLQISFLRIGDPWLARLDSVRFDTSDVYVSVHEGKDLNNRTPLNVEVEDADTQKPPNDLGFQLANTWPKITAPDVYAMGRNGPECKNR